MAEPSATSTTPTPAPDTPEPTAPAAETTPAPEPAAPTPTPEPAREPTPEPEPAAPVSTPTADATLAKLVTTADEPAEPDADDAKLPAGLIPDKAYDILKWVAIIVLPAIATFVVGLGGIWSWPVAGSVAATITAIGVLLGAVLGLSAVKYSASK